MNGKRLYPVVGQKKVAANDTEEWEEDTTFNSTTPTANETEIPSNLTIYNDTTTPVANESTVVLVNDTDTANTTDKNVSVVIEYQPYNDTPCENGTNLTCENEIPLVNPPEGTARPGEPEICTHPEEADENTTKLCEVIDPYMISDETFTYINALLQGFKYMNSLPSSMKCSDNIHLSVNTFIRNSIEWKNYTSSDWGLYVFDVTRWISYTLAPSTRYCYMVGLEGWRWVRVKGEQFPKGFDSWFPAWLQDLFGNVMTVNAIRLKLEKANEEVPPDRIAAFYWYGRLFDIAINFEPIDMDD